jgi:hypothetical protein
MATTHLTAPRAARPALLLTLRVLAAASLAAMGVIHIYLFNLGYSSVSLIGPLFLLNGIGAGLLMLAVLFSPRRFTALAGALSTLFTLGTLLALVLSLTVGLFGFDETMDAPLIKTTIVVEALGVLLCAGLTALAFGARSARATRTSPSTG